MSTPRHESEADALDKDERDALDSMVDFDDLVEGDVATDESLDDPEQR